MVNGNLWLFVHNIQHFLRSTCILHVLKAPTILCAHTNRALKNGANKSKKVLRTMLFAFKCKYLQIVKVFQ